MASLNHSDADDDDDDDDDRVTDDEHDSFLWRNVDKDKV